MGARTSDDHGDRKRFDELATRYQLNPEIRDIYVEGEWDRRFITWFLQKAGIEGVVVYDIDGVHVTAQHLAKYGLGEGKKERVIALAHELSPELEDSGQVTCIADRDYDTLLEKHHVSRLLLQTDYSCQEAYFLNEDTLGKFFAVVIGKPAPDIHDLLESLLIVLAALHLHRATNLSLGWGLEWLDAAKYCSVDTGRPVLSAGFTNRYLMKNARLQDGQVFNNELSRLRGKQSSNLLMHVTKDDLVALLSIIVRARGGNPAISRRDSLAASLSGCIEYADLMTFPLYQQLAARFSPST